MGQEQSTLTKEGYVNVKSTEIENYFVGTKNDDTYIIKKIYLTQLSKEALDTLESEIEILRKLNHCHLANIRNSFKDEHQNIYYIVMKQCQSESLADIIGKNPPLQVSEVLSKIVEICMALRVIHEENLLHKDLRPKNILLSEFGFMRLGNFGNIYESLPNQSGTDSNAAINYMAPEVFTKGTYDAKSDIWSLGCILYELCEQQQAFTAETPTKLMPKLLNADYEQLSEDRFPSVLRDLLSDLLKAEPDERPTANEILARPFIINCLVTKCKETVKELHTKLEKLRTLADGLQRVHEGATIGSLTGGVVGVLGGITSIVGLILAPFTLGASLIVTGVGVGVGAAGGVTAGASNITNMVSQSSDRKAVRRIIKEFEQKISVVISWLLEVKNSVQTAKNQCAQTPDIDSKCTEENLKRITLRAGRGLGGIAELIRLVTVINIGKVAAQTSRAVRVAEVATGILSGLFVAVDIFFIAMDAKEIHHIREAKRSNATPSSPETKTEETMTSSDQAELLPNSEDNAESDIRIEGEEASPPQPEIKSEIMKFVQSVREAAHSLEQVLQELDSIILSLLQEDNELEWQNM